MLCDVICQIGSEQMKQVSIDNSEWESLDPGNCDEDNTYLRVAFFALFCASCGKLHTTKKYHKKKPMDFKWPSSVDICRPGHLANPWRTVPKMVQCRSTPKAWDSKPTFVITNRSSPTGTNPPQKKSVISEWPHEMHQIPTIYGGFTTWNRRRLFDRNCQSPANDLDENPMVKP